MCVILSSINVVSLNSMVCGGPIHRIRGELLAYTKRHKDAMASIPLLG
jgi:hypothetical protein